MWTDTLHVGFLIVMIIVYHAVIRSSLHYGKRLRTLRQTCSTALERLHGGSTPEDNDLIVIVRNKQNKIV